MADILDIDAAVIGAGPAGLMAAEQLARGGLRVTVFDGMGAPARKFLLAGRGGLNLTHSEAKPDFLSRYGAAQARLAPAIEAFGPQQLRAWADDLGQRTFVGSSGRVFPVAMKASPLLRAWLRRLDAQGVQLRLKHRWTGWDGEGRLLVDTPDGSRAIAARATVLALGGASWPRLGSDGSWSGLLAAKGITIAPLRPANCGFVAEWSALFADKYQGAPLKNVALSFGTRTVRGEAVITREGIEGGAIYAISALLRDAILANGEAKLSIALRPDLTADDLVARLAKPKGKQSLSTYLRKTAGLPPAGIGLLQEAAHVSGVALATLPPDQLAALINAVPVRLVGTAPIEKAISTAGGIALDEIDANYMLHKLPGVFAAGEMLDWEAPTGGYLLTACFATGAEAGRGALRWLQRS
ncbi:NAD(P)/FAD-dependent oxidoreductase [Rhodopseudomonas palustris]|uniref:NAD(P)/FAD-dependent oxidoreductase n=1 Tax=Rhodopseudomonas palustris (strain ATCC BAA-98 / CGA009) TaxID=258594 RepID=Q6N7R9_RHOPA|nr:NAD(P)/FAD-dependent oxidoreductase [Rhodopseudomonas palustris]OPF90534.1 NAD(FAD)-utilizing dehydrogenase [Rhodopseudomonas palustris]PPQ42959.1 aminoacetone oxidase family FAD-binding enzyme [Rhodopseudomonas palustris]QQM03700.1 3-dehydro-bile acid delta(4,6)-reductase [Rhodopseudomonas palustris]RJF61784.1 aminoacetone oxidase family FAD-binding enzyme [Rhodopseudomonas palustris]WAB79840.1 NAD(P)/FAD-dependent oxidoreductase [Rhodopseudomonas palustris]